MIFVRENTQRDGRELPFRLLGGWGWGADIYISVSKLIGFETFANFLRVSVSENLVSEKKYRFGTVGWEQKGQEQKKEKEADNKKEEEDRKEEKADKKRQEEDKKK